MLNDVQVNFSEDGEPESVFVNGVPLTEIDNLDESPTGETGSTRWVFIGNEYIVKIPGKSENYKGNGEMFTVIDPEDQKYFALTEYVSIDKKWFVQRRINCVPQREVPKKAWRVLKSITKKYGLGDVSAWDGREYERVVPHNWTIDLEGNSVIYDYDHPW